MTSRDRQHAIPALITRQWLVEWGEVKFSEEEWRRKPEPVFYVFTLPAAVLKRLSKTYSREAEGPRSKDTRIQRSLDKKRSAEIGRFIHGGFPWSDLSERQKQSEEFHDLRMPGWLPTAIVANILSPGTRRGNSNINSADVIRIETLGDSMAQLILPDGYENGQWNPVVPPIEIIDGQHRLGAFENGASIEGDFELPVVAFYDLDITWQAYLFYTINIKPKRINASLAFDLYPILRIQEWIEKSPSGPIIYRQTRAQELTEALWSHPDSPWHGRINMLGKSKGGAVTQAAFIRSLTASYVKRWEGRGISVGGLFGAELHKDLGDVLEWNRPQQAAFLILAWQCIAEAVRQCDEPWANSLRQVPRQPELPLGGRQPELDAAFASDYSLLSSDQGVRGVLQVTNDMCYVAANELSLSDWYWDGEIDEDTISIEAITRALKSLASLPVKDFLTGIAGELMRFDWRSSSAPKLEDTERRAQMVYRGSGGYKELRRQLTRLLMSAHEPLVRATASDVWKRLGF